MSITIPLPEPPESEPLPLLACVAEGMMASGSGGSGGHRSNTERRHRVARKFRAAAVVAGMEGAEGRHRRHRHREARSRESPTQAEGGDRKTPEAGGPEGAAQPEVGANHTERGEDGQR